MTSDLTIGDRILGATSALVAEQGIRATTVDDIAARARCGRASVYRVFPGGRSEVFAASLAAELDTVFAVATAGASEVAAATGGFSADSVAGALHAVAVHLAEHAGLQQLLREEPEVILPLISFDALDPILERAADWGARQFAGHLGDEAAELLGEWCARVLLGHLRSPGSALDLTDRDSVQRLVRTFVVPDSPSTHPREFRTLRRSPS